MLLSRACELEELEELVCWRRAGEGCVVRSREERRGVMAAIGRGGVCENIDRRILRSNRIYSAGSRDCDEWCQAPPRADPGCEGALARDWELLGGEGGQDN